MSSHRPMMWVCTEYERGNLPKHVDGGRHTSLCEWVFSNATRIPRKRVKYQVDWTMHHQKEPERWIINFTLTSKNLLRGMSDIIPETLNGQFYVSEDEANDLMGVRHNPDRGHMIESLMEKHREQAFCVFENDWVNEQEPPKIEFKREQATE